MIKGRETLNKIKSMNEQSDKIKSDIISALDDNSLSLDEKWEILTSMDDLFETDMRTDFNLDRDEKFLFESPLYMEKYQTMNVDSILEALKDSESFGMTDEEEVIFKTYCVEHKVSKMCFDW